MKKIIFTISFLIFLMILLIVKPIRTNSVMQSIAKEDLENILFEQFGKSDYEKIMNNLKGPIVFINKDYTEFVWYQVLNKKDTAKIFINIYKYPKTVSLRDDFFWNKTTMNNNWSQIK